MDGYQSIKRVFQLGSRHPRQVARVRVGVGIWLLVVGAALHFCLAYRLFRIARADSDRRMRLQ